MLFLKKSTKKVKLIILFQKNCSSDSEQSLRRYGFSHKTVEHRMAAIISKKSRIWAKKEKESSNKVEKGAWRKTGFAAFSIGGFGQLGSGEGGGILSYLAAHR